MIITCECGKKKFNIDSSLIPEEGRLLKCGSCSKIWHYTPVLETKNDEDLEKLFSLILDNNIRSQDSPYLLASCLNNEKMGWKTWEFIEKNWDDLVIKFPEN